MTRSPTSQADALLVALFRRARSGAGPVPGWPPGLPTEVFAAAVGHHRGWPVLAALGDLVAGLPGELATEAVQRQRRAVQRRLVQDADLADSAVRLDTAGIPWACVKGPVLAARYQRVGLHRSASDLDLLVPPARLADALRALTTAGGGLLSRNFTLMRAELPGEVAVQAGRGTVVDLHWSLVNRSRRRRWTSVSTGELLDRARTDDVGGRPLRVLHPADALVHLCLHAGLAGGSRLGWLLDVALTVEQTPVDWAEVVRVARQWRVGRVVGLVLARSRRLLGAPVPRGVIGSLAGPSWRAAETVVGRRVPAARSDSDGWAARLVVGSAEHASVVVLGGTRLRRRLGARPPVRVAGSPLQDPGSTLYPSGDVGDLAAYLDAVAQEVG
ncbi:nucleotidyltransferase family protein [Modestobacter versicolor]|uniref:nucleotidyltransferase family protein n=1 Tax=Modestobacter versicolor TaxID=429133 RepID=UPI0034DDEFCF